MLARRQGKEEQALISICRYSSLADVSSCGCSCLCRYSASLGLLAELCRSCPSQSWMIPYPTYTILRDCVVVSSHSPREPSRGGHVEAKSHEKEAKYGQQMCGSARERQEIEMVLQRSDSLSLRFLARWRPFSLLLNQCIAARYLYYYIVIRFLVIFEIQLSFHFFTERHTGGNAKTNTDLPALIFKSGFVYIDSLHIFTFTATLALDNTSSY